MQGILNDLNTLDRSSLGGPIYRSEVVPKAVQLNFKPADPVEESLNKMYDYFTKVGTLESLYKSESETKIRDGFVAAFQSDILGLRISAESKNGKGKTDIMIDDLHGKHVVIAECKWWSGQEKASSALEQLFGYITSLDRVAALLFFVKEKNLEDICKKATHAIINNSQTERLYNIEDTWQRIVVKHPKDESIELQLHLMLFHYPQ